MSTAPPAAASDEARAVGAAPAHRRRPGAGSAGAPRAGRGGLHLPARLDARAHLAAAPAPAEAVPPRSRAGSRTRARDVLVARAGRDLVGRVSVRHELNSFLAELGGHIGYAVRPQFRGRGHATEMLRQALIVASAEGVERALATCDDDNAASRRVIERCGGVLEDVRPTESGGATRRYRIGLERSASRTSCGKAMIPHGKPSVEVHL